MEETPGLMRARDRVHPERKLGRLGRTLWEARMWIAGGGFVAWAFWQLVKLG